MHKILVVNNDIDAMDLIKMWLEKKAYKVEYTGNADDVPQIVQKFKPDVVLVDVLQENVVKKIKALEKDKKIPVILMTGYTISQQNFLQEDVDDIIEKPFNPAVLDKKIQKVLQKTG